MNRLAHLGELGMGETLKAKTAYRYKGDTEIAKVRPAEIEGRYYEIAQRTEWVPVIAGPTMDLVTQRDEENRDCMKRALLPEGTPAVTRTAELRLDDAFSVGKELFQGAK